MASNVSKRWLDSRLPVSNIFLETVPSQHHVGFLQIYVRPEIASFWGNQPSGCLGKCTIEIRSQAERTRSSSLTAGVCSVLKFIVS